ncbi:MAG: PEP-CTERM sorting domain-containing protein [Pirellulaceae bacterium]|nr:PEP-CTERM sorting domain-containing protein [Planctomycetales bacterium]
MKRKCLRHALVLVPLAIVAIVLSPATVAAATIFASGQLLIPGDPGIPPGQPGHDDSRENYVYAINTLTGTATPVSPVTTGLPAALAGTADQRLLGFSGGQLRVIEPTTAVQTNIGASNGLNSTGFEILPDGRGFLLPFDANFDTQQLFSIDITTGVAAPISSSATEIGDAIDTAAGNPLGTAEPFLISLGAVGNTLYGVDLDTDSLISLDPDTGAASVVGAVGAVGSVTNGPFSYSGFSALTGVDENEDGQFDALFGAVNFIDDGTGSQRLGGVARYDLTDGTWQLVGTNPGVIFFGFGSSPVPEPSTLTLFAGLGLITLTRRTMRRS